MQDEQKKNCSNYSVGLCIYCTDREKVIQGCKNPIAKGNFKWIFAATQLLRTMRVLNSYKL